MLQALAQVARGGLDKGAHRGLQAHPANGGLFRKVFRPVVGRFLDPAAHRQGQLLQQVLDDLTCFVSPDHVLMIYDDFGNASSSRATLSSTPLMNCTDSGAENRRAISSASLMTTGRGVSG